MRSRCVRFGHPNGPVSAIKCSTSSPNYFVKCYAQPLNDAYEMPLYAVGSRPPPTRLQKSDRFGKLTTQPQSSHRFESDQISAEFETQNRRQNWSTWAATIINRVAPDPLALNTNPCGLRFQTSKSIVYIIIDAKPKCVVIAKSIQQLALTSSFFRGLIEENESFDKEVSFKALIETCIRKQVIVGPAEGVGSSILEKCFTPLAWQRLFEIIFAENSDCFTPDADLDFIGRGDLTFCQILMALAAAPDQAQRSNNSKNHFLTIGAQTLSHLTQLSLSAIVTAQASLRQSPDEQLTLDQLLFGRSVGFCCRLLLQLLQGLIESGDREFHFCGDLLITGTSLLQDLADVVRTPTRSLEKLRLCVECCEGVVSDVKRQVDIVLSKLSVLEQRMSTPQIVDSIVQCAASSGSHPYLPCLLLLAESLGATSHLPTPLTPAIAVQANALTSLEVPHESASLFWALVATLGPPQRRLLLRLMALTRACKPRFSSCSTANAFAKKTPKFQTLPQHDNVFSDCDEAVHRSEGGSILTENATPERNLQNIAMPEPSRFWSTSFERSRGSALCLESKSAPSHRREEEIVCGDRIELAARRLERRLSEGSDFGDLNFFGSEGKSRIPKPASLPISTENVDVFQGETMEEDKQEVVQKTPDPPKRYADDVLKILSDLQLDVDVLDEKPKEGPTRKAKPKNKKLPTPPAREEPPATTISETPTDKQPRTRRPTTTSTAMDTTTSSDDKEIDVVRISSSGSGRESTSSGHKKRNVMMPAAPAASEIAARKEKVQRQHAAKLSEFKKVFSEKFKENAKKLEKCSIEGSGDILIMAPAPPSRSITTEIEKLIESKSVL